jgi:PAS domain S-box-containing protein
MSTAKTIRLSQWLNICLAVIPVLVLVGWALDITVLKRVSVGMAAMNPVSAVNFILCSVLLFISRGKIRSQRWLQVAPAIFVVLVGGIKLLEYTQLVHIYFDRYLFTRDVVKEPGFNAIAPNAALLFVFAGTIFINKGRTENGRLVNDILKMCGLLVAYLGVIGYLYSIRTAYRIGPFVPMALNTATCFFILFFTSIICLPKGKILQVFGSALTGGRLARSVIPILLLLPAAFGYLGLLGQRLGLYETEYSTALYTTFFIVGAFMLIYTYAIRLNKKDMEQKINQLRIQESEERFRTLVNTMKEGVIYFNRHGAISFCNKGFTDITGYGKEELVGKNLADLFNAEETRAMFEKKIAERAEGKADEYETELVHKMGYHVWVSVIIRPVYKNETDEVVASFATITDITERKKMMDELNSFSAVAAHDLNAPLTRIEMLASLLGEGAKEKLTEDELLYISMISNTAIHSKLMLKDLLRFAKLSAGNLKKETTDLGDIVTEAVEMGIHLNPNATLVIDKLPVVQADGPALLQVYTNLISNALKFSAKKESPRVHIGSYREDGRLVLFVKDNGDGFDMAKASNLFAPFQRLHADFEGNGLGLPIVKRIIEKHGGQIWAEAEKGKGASFYFTL